MTEGGVDVANDLPGAVHNSHGQARKIEDGDGIADQVNKNVQIGLNGLNGSQSVILETSLSGFRRRCV
jgi:hypothetical protein